MISTKLIFFFLCGGGDHGMVGVILRYVNIFGAICGFERALLLVLFVALVMFYL
jgi:hypothetical protein